MSSGALDFSTKLWKPINVDSDQISNGDANSSSNSSPQMPSSTLSPKSTDSTSTNPALSTTFCPSAFTAGSLVQHQQQLNQLNHPQLTAAALAQFLQQSNGVGTGSNQLMPYGALNLLSALSTSHHSLSQTMLPSILSTGTGQFNPQQHLHQHQPQQHDQVDSSYSSATSLALSTLQKRRKLMVDPRATTPNNLSSHDETKSEGGSPSSPSRKPGQATPDEKKDSAYWERRRKNNDAAKRSRDIRRQKEEHISMRATFLEQENLKLKAQVAVLKNETAKLHMMMFSSNSIGGKQIMGTTGAQHD